MTDRQGELLGVRISRHDQLDDTLVCVEGVGGGAGGDQHGGGDLRACK